MRPPRLIAVALAAILLLVTQNAAAVGNQVKITNGSDAVQAEHPYMVGLLYEDEDDGFSAQFCGGTLVGSRWVLTAAHCVEGFEDEELQILVGTIDLDDTVATRIGVRRIVVHPEFDFFTTGNDIALVELEEAVGPATTIALADAATVELEQAGTEVLLLGWGATSSDGGDFPTILQEARVPILSDSDCQRQLDGPDTNTLICAGDPDDDDYEDIGSCYGDSGGPLVAHDGNGSPVQIGVVSYGIEEECGTSTSGYTRVSAFGDWIASTAGIASGPATVERLAGADRYATAAGLATSRWSAGVPTAFVVTGTEFPDALAAAAAAGEAGGPVLLTDRDALPAATVAALRELTPESIVVVGGPGAVSDAVLAELGTLAGTTGASRVAGDSRYDTAAVLSKRTFPPGELPDTVFVASGATFADALGGAAAAAATRAPLLLTAERTLSTPTHAELGRIGPDVVYVLGGRASVSDAVVEAIAALGIPVERLAGADRYETSAVISQTIFGTSTEVVFASGLGFPDGLVAGALRAPVLLLPPDGVPTSTTAALETADPSRVLVLGGTGSVPDATLQAIVGMVRRE